MIRLRDFLDMLCSAAITPKGHAKQPQSPAHRWHPTLSEKSCNHRHPKSHLRHARHSHPSLPRWTRTPKNRHPQPRLWRFGSRPRTPRRLLQQAAKRPGHRPRLRLEGPPLQRAERLRWTPRLVDRWLVRNWVYHRLQHAFEASQEPHPLEEEHAGLGRGYRFKLFHRRECIIIPYFSLRSHGFRCSSRTHILPAFLTLQGASTGTGTIFPLDGQLAQLASREPNLPHSLKR